jgi:hypothetical protein
MKKLLQTKKSSRRIESKKVTSRGSGKSKPAPVPANPPIASDDRLGSDEPVDEAASREGKVAGTTPASDGVETADHRVRKIEPDDEHNNENLIEEGMQGYMRGSLTKARKAAPGKRASTGQKSGT